MKIRIKGEMTLAQMRQLLFEELLNVEERFAVRHSLDATLYINPTNGFGDYVSPRYSNGQEVKVVYAAAPYRSAADLYEV
ncbi:MAG: hypothetical protein GKS00_22165 [Alphaproteobacteria bacterium]|nr:hypothetical protein [Alphaproteobacteria bacterium]